MPDHELDLWCTVLSCRGPDCSTQVHVTPVIEHIASVRT